MLRSAPEKRLAPAAARLCLRPTNACSAVRVSPPQRENLRPGVSTTTHTHVRPSVALPGAVVATSEILALHNHRASHVREPAPERVTSRSINPTTPALVAIAKRSIPRDQTYKAISIRLARAHTHSHTHTHTHARPAKMSAAVEQAVIPAAAKPDKKQAASSKPRISTPVSLIAGGTAGAIEAFVTYPFEFAKTRGQLINTGAAKVTNPFSIITTVARTQGVGAIYTGCSTLAVGATFKASVRFMSYDAIKNVLSDDKGKLTPMRGILAGMVAGAVESVVAVTPTERVKTALIDDARSPNGKRFRGGFDAMRTIVREGGLPGLYRGLVSSTLKQSTTSATRMGSYNMLKNAAESWKLPQNSAVTFATGAVAGVITVYVTQPFDTIKTRTQSAAGASTTAAFRTVLAQDGIRGFWAGSTMRLGRLVFSGGIIFTVYEKIAGILTGSGM
ncbi:solute carrier family 25 (mitochondrial citrate transporter) member 1 [Microdochium nivale]|nr:solute carrier family 25 (mitochondrial citrate transporter) member 1 [Microdochium nivale]